MKMSCLPVSLYPELTAKQRTLSDWFKLAADLGLDGADLSVVHLESIDPPYLRGLRKLAEALGIRIAMVVTYADFTHPEAAERSNQVRSVSRYIKVAKALDAEFLRVTAGQAHPGLERETAIGWAVAGLTLCLDDAEKAGVTLCYENHTKGYAWTYFDFSQPAEIFLEIIRRTEGTGLRLLYDTANTLATGDDPLAVLEQVKHRVSMIHVNDIARAGYYEPVLLGEGVAPIVPQFRILANAGFDGWISVEEASKRGEEGLRKAIPYAEAAWLEAGGKPRS